MSKVFSETFRNVSVVNAVRAANYVELTSEIEQSSDNINIKFWFHWHEPEGFNCYGVSYLWYIRFLDASGNKIVDINVTPTNVSGYAARLFYYPTSTSQSFPVNASNCHTEAVLDRYANDDASNGSGTAQRKNVATNPTQYWNNVQKCKRGETVRTADMTKMSVNIPMSQVPINAKAYCNHVAFAQYTDNGHVQDPTDPANQFGQYTFPAESVAINTDPLIIDFATKLYFKNNSWTNTGRIWHKENGTWQKRYLYKKINGTWTKLQ